MREIRAKQTLTHSMSREGYVRVEDKHNKQHPDKPLTKAKLWIKGHEPKKSKNHVVAAKVAEVQAKIDSLLPTTDDGEVAVEEDILTQVFGKDRPGRVRGLGAGVTKTKPGVSRSDSKIEELRSALNKEVARRKRLEDIIAKKPRINLYELDDDDDASRKHHSELSKNQVQCDASATPEVVRTSLSGQGSNHHHSCNDKCKLLNWNDSGEVVAIGSISAMDPKSTVHGYTLGPDYYRVSIEDVFVERA